MNNKFDDLMYRAGLTADGCWFEMDNYDQIAIMKFAELIVSECARVARATPCPYTDELMRQQLGHTWDMASSAAGREIIQHFGVE